MSVGGAGAVTSSQIMDLVKQMIAPDMDKIKAMRDDVNQYEDKKLAYNNIDRALESLTDILKTLTKESSFSTRVASTSDLNLVTATASSNAAKTSFTFSSITQLASAAKVTSSSDLGLVSGSAPYLLSTSDINGGNLGDYDANTALNSSSQELNITSGTITINGVSIEIEGSDTLYTILSRINNSGAGVVATFDEDNDTVRISGTTVGSDETITFSSGDTNFFEELNLDSSLTDGTDPDKDKAFDNLSSGPLSGVSSGYFNVNNYTFYIDSSTDSLTDVINRINSSNCGAVAFYDDDTGKVTITNEKTGEPLILDNDTSGFLNAIGVLDQTDDQDSDAGKSLYLGDKAIFTLNGETMSKDSNVFTIGGVTFTLIGTTSTENPSATVSVSADSSTTVEHVNNYVSQFNATMSMLNDTINEDGGPLEKDIVIRRLMTNLRTKVLSQIENPGRYGSLVDIGFSFERGDGIFKLTLDEDKFREALSTDEASVRQLFAYNNDTDGLLDDGGYAVETIDMLDDYTRAVTGFFYKQNDKIDENIERLQLKIYDAEEKLKDKSDRQFKRILESVSALQELSLEGQRTSQINSIVMSGLASSSAALLAM